MNPDASDVEMPSVSKVSWTKVANYFCLNNF